MLLKVLFLDVSTECLLGSIEDYLLVRTAFSWTVIPIEYVVIEEALFNGAIGLNQSALPALQASYPVAFVHCAICEVHFPVAVSLIIDVMTLVNITRLPKELTVPVFLILLVLTLIPVTLNIVLILPPDSFAMLKPVQKLAFVAAAIGPRIHTFPMRFPILILPYISVSVSEEVSSLPVFDALDPLPIISVIF